MSPLRMIFVQMKIVMKHSTITMTSRLKPLWRNPSRLQSHSHFFLHLSLETVVSFRLLSISSNLDTCILLCDRLGEYIQYSFCFQRADCVLPSNRPCDRTFLWVAVLRYSLYSVRPRPSSNGEVSSKATCWDWSEMPWRCYCLMLAFIFWKGSHKYLYQRCSRSSLRLE
jgi:hypothetical protein